jgi:hypothetical protein
MRQLTLLGWGILTLSLPAQEWLPMSLAPIPRERALQEPR